MSRDEQHARRLRPDCANAYSNLAGILYSAGQLEEAVAALKKAMELNPAFARAYSNWAWLLPIWTETTRRLNL
jgi:Flp pilus assembly protein TadD